MGEGLLYQNFAIDIHYLTTCITILPHFIKVLTLKTKWRQMHQKPRGQKPLTKIKWWWITSSCWLIAIKVMSCMKTIRKKRNTWPEMHKNVSPSTSPKKCTIYLHFDYISLYKECVISCIISSLIITIYVKDLLTYKYWLIEEWCLLWDRFLNNYRPILR